MESIQTTQSKEAKEQQNSIGGFSKFLTWVEGTTTVNIYDTITRKKESFEVKTKIPADADGAMVKDKLYVMGGYPELKSTYEIDANKREIV